MSQESVIGSNNSLATLAAALREVRARSGSLPYRGMARLAHVSHTTLSRAAAGKSLPTWEVTKAYVTVCGADPQDYLQLWQAAAASIRPANPEISSGQVHPAVITIDPLTAGSVEDFRRMLRETQARHGRPSYHEISKQAHRPVSTVADAFNLNRRQLPSWPITEAVLRALGEGEALQRWRMAWTNLSAPVVRTPQDNDSMQALIRQVTEIGLVGIYPTRGEAVASFGTPLQREIRSGGRLWIVGSSMKGFSAQIIGQIDGVRMVSRALHAGCDVRIVCTHPTQADARAEQEGREFGAIYSEISLSLANLKEAGLRRQNVRFCKGAPTVFGICTSDHMLLNPYPYGNEAFLNFTMIVKKTFKNGIFARYLEEHFEKSWTSGEEVSQDEWNRHGGKSLESRERRSNRQN